MHAKATPNMMMAKPNVSFGPLRSSKGPPMSGPAIMLQPPTHEAPIANGVTSAMANFVMRSG